MSNRKTWALLAAVAAVAVGGVARAESVSAAANPESLSLSRPVALSTGEKRGLLMQGFDAVGVGKALDDLRINIGGHVAASVTYYPDPVNGKVQPGRGFDSENQDPTLNQVSVFVERMVDARKGEFDIGGKMEWIYGGDARFIHSTGLFDHYGFGDGPDEQFDLTQLYIDVAVAGVRVRAGKFLTGAGYETINPTTTPFHSRGLLYTYLLPFTHTGITGEFYVGNWAFELGVIRGWDDALEDKNGGVSFYGRTVYTYNDGKSMAAATFIAGPEYANNSGDYRYLLDIVYTHKYSDQWTFAIQGDLLVESDQDGRGPSSDYGVAFGLAGFASYEFSQYFTFNGRLEYLYDGSAFRFNPPVFGDDGFGNIIVLPGTGEPNNIYSTALGVTITPFPTDNIGSNLKIIPEMRYDYAQNAIFGGNNHQLSFALSAYFTF